MRVVSSRSFRSAPLFPVGPGARSTRRSLASGGSRIWRLARLAHSATRDLHSCSRVDARCCRSRDRVCPQSAAREGSSALIMMAVSRTERQPWERDHTLLVVVQGGTCANEACRSLLDPRIAGASRRRSELPLVISRSRATLLQRQVIELETPFGFVPRLVGDAVGFRALGVCSTATAACPGQLVCRLWVSARACAARTAALRSGRSANGAIVSSSSATEAWSASLAQTWA
jgi:hypothetical protein